jgi:uncharacterized damage-inducible protein DinB
MQAREDLARWTEGLSADRLWATPRGCGAVGFHIRHIAGSTTRLFTYLQGRQLTAAQLAAISAEKTAGAGRDELLAELEDAFCAAEAVVRALDPAALAESREVGRTRLPATVIGLLTHVAEHTQRHVGQAISAAQWASR